MNRLRLTVVALSLLGPVITVLAHHNNRAIYDPDNVIDIEGVVTEVWYVNPHSRVYIDVTNDAAETEIWQAETLDRSQLDRRGWKYGDLVEGDQVVATGRVARDGSKRIQLLEILRPSDGWIGYGYRGNTQPD